MKNKNINGVESRADVVHVAGEIYVWRQNFRQAFDYQFAVNFSKPDELIIRSVFSQSNEFSSAFPGDDQADCSDR